MKPALRIKDLCRGIGLVEITVGNTGPFYAQLTLLTGAEGFSFIIHHLDFRIIHAFTAGSYPGFGIGCGCAHTGGLREPPGLCITPLELILYLTNQILGHLGGGGEAKDH